MLVSELVPESSVTSGNPESALSLGFWMPRWQLVLVLLGQLKSACSVGYFQLSTNGLCLTPLPSS